MTEIHPQACVDSKARIGNDVRIGPFCVIGPAVQIGDGCALHNNVTITGKTRIGSCNEFFAGAAIGGCPQDLKYKGTETQLDIGDQNIFREGTTVHTGTEVGGGVTRVGSHNRFLVGVHLAHDTQVGSHCVVANYVQLAGHVHIEDHCHVGGVAAFHHFVTVGRYSYVGGMARVTVDVPPYMVMQGYPARVRGLNLNGLSRWGLGDQNIANLKEAYRTIFSKKAEEAIPNLLDRIGRIESNGRLDEHTRYLCEFLRRSTHQGVYGRYRESLRTDSSDDRREFYAQGEDETDPVRSGDKP